MNHPNEQGELQHYKVTRWDTLRYQLKAKWIRLSANIDAIWWYLRSRK